MEHLASQCLVKINCQFNYQHDKTCKYHDDSQKRRKKIVTKEKKKMKNAQPTSRDKGIKEGRLDFTTPPLQISLSHTHKVIQHPSTLSQNTQTSTHTHPHTAQTKNSNMDSLLNTCFHKVTEPAN